MQLLNCHEIFVHHDTSMLDKFPDSAISLDEAALTLVCSKLVTRNTYNGLSSNLQKTFHM